MSRVILAFLLILFLSSCDYNPLINNRTTGSPVGAVVGAGIGAGGVALLNGPRPLIVAAGLGGGAIGYYVTTLRYDSGGVMLGGGQIYKVGDFVGINIPTDQLFEPNTDDFLPQAKPILDSAADVLNRYPNNNIMISGNTSGFDLPVRERRLSEHRAQKVAAYLWNAGISQFTEHDLGTRKLNYVGYGNFFPIANDYTNDGIRANSRVQITSYPDDCDLHLDKRQAAIFNIGSMDDSRINEAPACADGEDCTND